MGSLLAEVRSCAAVGRVRAASSSSLASSLLLEFVHLSVRSTISWPRLRTATGSAGGPPACMHRLPRSNEQKGGWARFSLWRNRARAVRMRPRIHAGEPLALPVAILSIPTSSIQLLWTALSWPRRRSKQSCTNSRAVSLRDCGASTSYRAGACSSSSCTPPAVWSAAAVASMSKTCLGLWASRR